MTDKQQRFAAEYVRDYNATEAAIRAGYTNNRRSAATIGVRLLKNVEIRAYINEVSAVVVGDAIADAIEVAQFYTRVMRDSAAPWAARMMAAAALARRVPPPSEPDTPMIVDDVSDDCRAVNTERIEHTFDSFACIGIDGPGGEC